MTRRRRWDRIVFEDKGTVRDAQRGGGKRHGPMSPERIQVLAAKILANRKKPNED